MPIVSACWKNESCLNSSSSFVRCPSSKTNSADGREHILFDCVKEWGVIFILEN